MPTTEPWFSRQDTKHAIDQIARQPNLVLVLGAGVGVDSGLPAWNDLVLDLLEQHGAELLGREGANLPHARAFAEELVKRLGVLPAGTVAQTLASSSVGFARMLKDTLYRSVYDAEELDVGPLARRAASLALTAGSPKAITTNYDDILERALAGQLEAAGDEAKVVSISRPDQTAPEPSFAVLHVHGFLPFSGATDADTTGRIVVGERDFALTDEWDEWRRKLYSETFKEATCVFVGTSINDTNVLRYLYGMEDPAKHFGFFVREDSPFTRGADGDSLVAEAVERALEQRLIRLGINAVVPDYYGQVGQALNEVTLWRYELDGLDPADRDRVRYADWDRRYGKRLMTWREKFEALAFPTAGPEFRICEQRTHDFVRQTFSELRERLLGRSDELFALHVWARQPKVVAGEPRALQLWTTSIGTVAHPALIQSARIEEGSRWHAVQTFCSGTRGLFNRMASPTTTRWRYTLAQPIFLEDDPWDGLPVGVVMLSSDRPEATSVLGAQRPLRAQVWETLALVGAQLLDPNRLAEVVKTGDPEKPTR